VRTGQGSELDPGFSCVPTSSLESARRASETARSTAFSQVCGSAPHEATDGRRMLAGRQRARSVISSSLCLGSAPPGRADLRLLVRSHAWRRPLPGSGRTASALGRTRILINARSYSDRGWLRAARRAPACRSLRDDDACRWLLPPWPIPSRFGERPRRLGPARLSRPRAEGDTHGGPILEDRGVRRDADWFSGRPPAHPSSRTACPHDATAAYRVSSGKRELKEESQVSAAAAPRDRRGAASGTRPDCASV
jgi:hypothetical protein